MKLREIGSNQTEIILDNATVLFSYETPVAAWVNGKGYRTDKFWSNTTSKHISRYGLKDAEKKPQEFFDNLVKGV